jgi:hypothetical protein
MVFLWLNRAQTIAPPLLRDRYLTSMRLLSEAIIENVFAFCPPYLAAFSSLFLSVLPQTTSGIAIPAEQNHFTSTHDTRFSSLEAVLLVSWLLRRFTAEA